MRSKTLCAVISVVLAVSLFPGPDLLYAKRMGGGGGRSSRSLPPRGSPSGSKFTPPPAPGYGNTGIKPQPGKVPTREGYGNTGTRPSGAAPAPSGSSGYGNTATSSPQTKSAPAGPAASKSTPLQERMNRSFSKQESAKAYADYKAQQGKFQMSSKPGDYKPSARETATINSAQSRYGYSSGPEYYARRTVFYDTYRWSPPVYVYRSYSTFGIWDAMILWFMLDHIQEAQYAAMYYNHMNDPGMQKFRQEAERLSAENAELKAKLAKMDESAKSLDQKGVKPDPTYMPPDAADIALAADIAGKGVPRSGGFPWTWVIVVGGLIFIGYLSLRRRR